MSEFGTGFTYCLGLYLAHAESTLDDNIWFYASTDHLFELVIPENVSGVLRDRIIKFKTTALDFRFSGATEKDRAESIQEAKDILLAYDEHLDIPCEKGEWE